MVTNHSDFNFLEKGLWFEEESNVHLQFIKKLVKKKHYFQQNQ